MKEYFKNLLLKLKTPKVWFAFLWVALSLAIICVTLASLAVDFLPEIVEYVFYGVSAVGLTYSTYIVIIIIPHIKGWAIALLNKTQFTKNVLEDYGFRTTVFAVMTFTISVGYAIMEGVIAITSRSVWFGALAGYYIMLALSRGVLLNSKRLIRKRVHGKNHEYAIKMIKTFRATGVSLLVLTVALSGAVFYMVRDKNNFSYPGFTIFASAAYAFYKIIMSVYNFVKAKKYEDLTVWAIRNVNLSDALVSILALQTAMFEQFAVGQNVDVYNIATATAVCAVIIAVGIYMIAKANKTLKKYEKEK